MRVVERRPRVTPHAPSHLRGDPRYAALASIRTPAELRNRSARSKISKAQKVQFTDPYPEVPGTLPEKMVYAALMERHIPFQFQYPIHFAIPLVSDTWHRADFILPYQKLIIDVNGFYFHSKPAQIDKDSTIAAFAQLSGWRVAFWWDFDIYDHLDLLFLMENLGIAQTQSGFGSPGRGDRKQRSDSTGVKTLNKRRTHRIRKTRVALKYRTGRKLKPLTKVKAKF